MISRPLSSVRLSLSPSRHLHGTPPLLASHLGPPCSSLNQTSHHDVAGKRRMSSCQRMSPPFIPRPIPTNSSCHSNAFPTRMVLQTTRASITRPCSANIQKFHPRHFSSSSKSSLRKLIRPFLLACHPDAMSNNNNNNDTDDDTSAPSKKRTSQTAKQVNLQAVQTLNGLIDTCDEWIHRCYGTTTNTSTSTTAAAPPLPELHERYTIEFLLPGPTSTTDHGDELRVKPRRGKRRGGGGEWTMRSIVLEFPRELRDRVRPWARHHQNHHDENEEGNSEAMRAGRTLKRHVERELRRLLIVAGLEYEGVSQEEWWTMPYDDEGEERNMFGSRKKGREEWTLSDHFLYELGIEPTADLSSTSSSTHAEQFGKSSAFYGRNASAVGGGGKSKKYDAPPPTYSHVHAQREAFLKSIRWDKFRDKYEEAWEDAQADFATSRMNLFNVNTREGRERRERLVSMICGRVRIWTGGSGESHVEEEEEDIPEGLDVVQQLVAIRRLSSILYDNFDYLRMEKMGRMWENLVIVLTPPRSGRRRRQALMPQESGEDGGSLPDGIVDVVQRQHSPHPGRKLNKWERRMKRRERTVPPSRGIMRRVAESHFHSLNNTQDNYSNHPHESHDAAGDPNQSTQYTSPAQTFQPRFKFSYGTQSEQGTGQVTAYIPIDFKDEELVQKLHTYLYDYFDNACSTAGFLRVGPDGEVTANVDGVEDYDEDGMKAAN
ncbi:hypothetical protein HJC23_002064 [Cyclotella cryptica]|uniref:DUF4460 domain-containing protein n=1 Tax=Cyclotella cryptica TaxID=29204 RepID=A0ABD3Q5Q8_9STRA|eukprot:CCRYP_008314-RB/>CCRYP_008314-RB protein AED:0.02 eAED:0.02 QI:181/-1/1/1/-1/1/1/353/715